MNAQDSQLAERAERAKALDDFAAPPAGNAVSLAPHQFPASVDRVFGAQNVAVRRDEQEVLRKIKALAAAAGGEWLYRFPVRNKRENRTDYIEGPTIKLANDLARIYGNAEVDTRVIDVGESWLIYARFSDFETGYSLTRPFQQRKSQRSVGGGDDARGLDIALQIGVSKAIRNVVVNALQTYADFAFDEARNSLVDKIGKDLPAWRARVIERLEANGVDVHRAETVIGRVAGEWLAPDVARVIAMMKAVTDGMASLDETFPPLGVKTDAETAQGEKSETADNATEGKTASPQELPPASGQSAPDPQQQPSQGIEAEKGADKAAPTTKDKKGGEFVPSTDAEYSAFASAWIAKATKADEADGRWKAEKPIRKKCNITQDTFDELETALKKRVTELRAAGTGEP